MNNYSVSLQEEVSVIKQKTVDKLRQLDEKYALNDRIAKWLPWTGLLIIAAFVIVLILSDLRNILSVCKRSISTKKVSRFPVNELQLYKISEEPQLNFDEIIQKNAIVSMKLKRFLENQLNESSL